MTARPDKPAAGEPPLDGSFAPSFQPQRYGEYELIFKKVAQPGERVSLEVDLVPVARPGSREVVTSPPGARISIDGVDAGRRSPAVIENVAAGTRTVAVELDAHGPEERKVLVTAGDRARLLFELRPLAEE